jgi:60kDa lysophospholipase
VPPVRGVVLETFGSGNAPQRNDLMNALREACERGVVIVAITQCARGSVSDAYETGRKLLQAGVVAGGDMTPEVCIPFPPPFPHRQKKKKEKIPFLP